MSAIGGLTILEMPGKEISKGSYGVVYEGELKGKPVTVKKIHRILLRTERAQKVSELIFTSSFLLKQLSHPHIVKILEVYQSKEEGPLIVIERLDHNLRQHLWLHRGKLSTERQVDICLQIADAVHYLHSQQPPVVYRNLSAEHVLLGKHGILKLGATSSVARLPPSGYFDIAAPGIIYFMISRVLKENERYNEKIDIFALGVLMLEIATQHFPLSMLPGCSIASERNAHSQQLSHLSEDHPLKPIILQCVRDDPGERPDSGKVFRMLSEAMLQSTYWEALEKHGSVSVGVTPCIFIGPPAVGKSSLKHLLVHNTPKAVKTSTAVMVTPEVVSISSEQYTVEGGTSAWQLVSNDVMGNSLRACINTRAYDVNSQYPSAEVGEMNRGQQGSSPEEQGATLPRSSPTLQHQQQHSNTALAQTTKKEGSVSETNATAFLDRQHSQLLQEMGGDAEKVKLNDATFIHLLDTGGQPSFQDVLPLLLDAPCTYIQVFNAARDLDQPVPITYRPDDHTEEVLPPSAETDWEMMLRSLSSMQTMAHKCSKELATFQEEEGQLPHFCIFIVGTFMDQLMKEGRHDKAVQDISRRLRGLKGKPYYHSFRWDPVGRPFYLINSMADEGADKISANHLREHLSSGGSSLKLNVPVMWYMCQQITQREPVKFFKFNELKAFCLKHHFIDASNVDSQFRSLLKLFSLLGFYSFFDLKDVPDDANCVCTDRGVFLKEVSKLLAVQFATPKSPTMERFKETGILVFTPQLFQELGMSQKMDLHWFLKALCHLGIAACLPTKKRPEYFIPAALPQKSVLQHPAASVAPLCLTYKTKDSAVFSYSDLPQGVFCRLAVELIRQEWVIIENESTRTLLKFRWKEFELFLEECPGYISLIPQVVEEFSSLSELHTGCEGLLNTITTSLSLSTEAVLGSHFSTVAELKVGFECPCREVTVPHLTVLSSTGKSLMCTQTSSRQTYSRHQRIWFSAVDRTKLKYSSDHNIWALLDCDCSGKASTPHNADSPQRDTVSGDHMKDTILTQKVYDRPGHLMLFRRHVSRTAAGKGRAVLEGVGLDAVVIEACFEDHSKNAEEAIQTGLTKWCGGQGSPPTWRVLLEAMEYAEIAQHYIQGLKTDLGLD